MPTLIELPPPPVRAMPPKLRSTRLAVSACFLWNGLLFATWVSRIPAVQTRLGLTPGTFGLALLCLGIGAVVAMPLAGWASARVGSRRVTVICALGCASLIPLLAVAPSTAWLAAVLFFFGAMHGGFDVAMNAQAVAVETLYERPIMSSFHALWSLGGLLGAALGGAIAAAGIPPLLHFTTATVILGVLGCTLGLPYLLTSTARVTHERSPGFGLHVPRALVALGIIAFCVMMGEGAMADWSAMYLRNTLGSSEAVAAAGYAAFSLAMAVGRFTGDWLTARFGAVALLRASGVLAVAGLLLALLVGKPWAALVGFAAVGAGFATVVPLVFSAAGRTPRVSPGVALATVTTVGYTGFLVGPPIIGFIAELLGIRGALGLTVVTSSLLTLLAANVRPLRAETA